MKIFNQILKKNRNDTLYVIGNGFDVQNNLPTSYNKFHTYLKNRYAANDVYLNEFGRFEIKRKNKNAPNDKQNATCICQMINASLKKNFPKSNKATQPDWCDFETILGKLRYEDVWEEGEKNELNGVIMHIAFSQLPTYFRSWIESVDVKKAVPIKDFPKRGENALFLSFNYTTTLETIYDVPAEKICYIQGKCGTEQELLFGHKENNEWQDDTSSADRQIGIIRDMYIKDVQEVIRQNKDFFTKLNKNIKRVISVGFSYGEVDELYMREIIRRINKNAVWYLFDFKSEETLKQKEKIKGYGFKGEIVSFKNWKEPYLKSVSL